MKKLYFLSLLLIFSLLLSSCSSSEFDIHETSNEIRLLIEEKTRSEEYWQLKSSGYSSLEELREKLIANDYDRPIRCYKIQLLDLDKALEELIIRDTEDPEHYSNLSDSLKEELTNVYKHYPITIMTQILHWLSINSRVQEDLACSTTKVIENAKIGDTVVGYLYIFETGKPIIVYYGQIGKSEVVAIGTFITNSDYKTLSKTRDIFEPYGCTVEIEFDT